MTTAAKRSFGIELWFAPEGETVVKIAELKTLNPPKRSRGTIDVTTHDSPEGAMEFITEGLYNTGEVSGTVHYGVDADQDEAFIDAVESGDLLDIKIVMKSETGTEDQEFQGFMTEFGPNGQEVEGVQMADFGIKVSGGITNSPSPAPSPTPTPGG